MTSMKAYILGVKKQNYKKKNLKKNGNEKLPVN